MCQPKGPGHRPEAEKDVGYLPFYLHTVAVVRLVNVVVVVTPP